MKEENIDAMEALLESSRDKIGAAKIKSAYINKIRNQGFSDITRLLLVQPEIDPNETDSQGKTWLWKHAEVGSREGTMMLLEHPGIDPNKTDDTGRAPLEKAVEGYKNKLPVGVFFARGAITRHVDSLEVGGIMYGANAYAEVVRALWKHPRTDRNVVTQHDIDRIMELAGLAV